MWSEVSFEKVEGLPVLLAPGEEVVAVLQEVFARGNRVRMEVRGWSMHPALQDGDIVWIEPADPHRLRSGDVVLYQTPNGRPVVHRLRKRVGKGSNARVYIQGDAEPGSGEWVAPERVLGRVIRVERCGRRTLLAGWYLRLRRCSSLVRWMPRPLKELLQALFGLIGWS